MENYAYAQLCMGTTADPRHTGLAENDPELAITDLHQASFEPPHPVGETGFRAPLSTDASPEPRPVPWRQAATQAHPTTWADADELTLLEQIAAGSATALRQFYQLYQHPIMAFARRLLRSERDCQEIINDVLLTVWSCAGGFAGRSRVRTWVLGITHHKVIDYLRKQQRATRLKQEYARHKTVLVPENNVEKAMEALDCSSLVQTCLRQLKPIHREVLYLAFFAELSCSEIASVLDCPMGTVKTRLMHAKERMKVLLNTGIEHKTQPETSRVSCTKQE